MTKNIYVVHIYSTSIIPLFLDFTDQNLGAVRKKDGVALILEGLTQHMEHARLVKHACMALAAMVEPDGKDVLDLIMK